MRTHEEFLSEARRVEAIGALFVDEHSRAAALGRVLPPRVIPTLLAPPMLPRERWVEAEMIDGAIEFRLVESDGAAGSRSTLFASDSAYDVLIEGDELEQKEKLGEALSPIIERVARHEFNDSVEAAIGEEVEALIEIGELDPATRLRTKADIVELLGGQMDPSVFVSLVVERRAHCHELRESISQRPDEQRMIEQI
jgi:hypothetical protein